VKQKGVEIIIPRVGLVRTGRGWHRQVKLQRRLGGKTGRK
jgi:hypothetical protein